MPRSLIVVRNTRSTTPCTSVFGSENPWRGVSLPHSWVRCSDGNVITVLVSGSRPRRSQLTDQKCSTNRPADSDGAHRFRSNNGVERRTADHAAQRGACGSSSCPRPRSPGYEGTRPVGQTDDPTVACPNLYPYVMRTLCDQVVVAGRGDADLRRPTRRPRRQRSRRLPRRLGVRAVVEAAAERRLDGYGRGRGPKRSAGRPSRCHPTRRALWRGTGEGGSDGMTVAFGVGFDNGNVTALHRRDRPEPRVR